MFIRFISHNGQHRHVAEWMAQLVREAGDEPIVMSPLPGDYEVIHRMGTRVWMLRMTKLLLMADSLIYVHMTGEQPNEATAAEIRFMGMRRKPVEELIFDEPDIRAHKPVWRRASVEVFDIKQPGPEGAWFDPPLEQIDLEYACPPLKAPHPNNCEWTPQEPDLLHTLSIEELKERGDSMLNGLLHHQGWLDENDINMTAAVLFERHCRDAYDDAPRMKAIAELVHEWKARLVNEHLHKPKRKAGPQTSPETAPHAGSQPTTLVVDGRGKGDFSTIREALAAAAPGSRIQIEPGVYRESIVIEKPVELVGQGKREEIVLEDEGGDIVLFQAPSGRIANLTLRQVSGGGSGVHIIEGQLQLEGCDISSQGSCGLYVRAGATPRIHHNRIHDCRQVGAYVTDDGHGVIEDNEFSNNDVAIVVRLGSDPIIRSNRIHGSSGGAVWVTYGGRGVLESNDISQSKSGVVVEHGGSPRLLHNHIHDNEDYGVLIFDGGHGVVEDNDIAANALVGVACMEHGTASIRANRIHGNGRVAIRMRSEAGGDIEGNDLRDNGKGALDIDESSRGRLSVRANIQ